MAWENWLSRMFPACAGMNRIILPQIESLANVPRVRGDEPISIDYKKFEKECSPRARG